MLAASTPMPEVSNRRRSVFCWTRSRYAIAEVIKRSVEGAQNSCDPSR
jgi:hypothetical protein